MLPVDIVLLRHGQSEGNKAHRASEEGDNRFFTPEFRDKHSRNFRLTDLGIRQAKTAGEWLKQNVPMPLDRFYVSDYIRAKETAVYLDLSGAEWKDEIGLRERDLALMDNLPDDEKKHPFELEVRQHEIDPFFSYPAGGSESVAALIFRVKTDLVAHLARECSDKRVMIVCHGHVMRALQFLFEKLSHDDFIRLDSSKEPADKLRNCQVIWYTRRDPETGKIAGDKLVAVRS
ncbi:MAG: phosphoglycerate mutase family protein, partial [Patescibacteria group bacterium]